MKTIQKTNSLKNLRNLMSLMSLMSLISLTPLHAQVRIGEDVVPTKGTVLDLSNTSDGYIGGLKLPNVSITDLNTIPTSFKESATITENTDKEALVGTVVYNTNTTTGAGIYCWNGTKWIKQTDATSGSAAGIPEAPQDDNAYIRKNGMD